MSQSQATKELNKLTNIPEKTLGKVLDKIPYIICDTIENSIKEGKEVSEIDLHFGTLLIQYREGQIKYKFVPNAKLEKDITSTIISKKNPLEASLEQIVTSRFINLYKDLC